MIATNIEVLPLADGTKRVSFITRSEVDLPADKELDVSIKVHRQKRSLTSNAYLWILCDKLAAKLKSTKEEVYREAIRKVGLFDYIAIQDSRLEAFLRHWNSQGIGNYAEATERARRDGYTVVQVYQGSSVYDTSEMSRLIEYIVEEAKEQGIETLTPEELARMGVIK